MKYLNKVVFINSADKSLRYAEVNIDGNVHFIGTQGVGKSTLLRAILFFYNADKQKLGISREKKTFDEFYFPYQNSYLVYEVQTGNGPFCVLAFKSQGRVAFRFFDAAYEQRFFIDGDGRTFESWDKTREAFGTRTGYTRIVHSYEEYRNILYGNNKGLPPEFRKYALLESRQFQNIPRTITNVFLNANLSAEFVKETIIKSLNEEEIKIDLTTYSQTHLRDFETNLNDIRKWTDRNRNGENALEKQADKVATAFNSLRYLESRKSELAVQLGWAVQHVRQTLPEKREQLSTEVLKQAKTKQKLQELDAVFSKKRDKIQEQIGKYKDRLDEIKNRQERYEALNIDSILKRSAQKSSWDFEKKKLTEENELLKAAFGDIEHRYEAMFNQMENHLNAFANGKQNEKNTAREQFFYFKEDISRQYEQLFDSIRTQHKEQLEVATTLISDKKEAIAANRVQRAEVRNKRFFEKEIKACTDEMEACRLSIEKAERTIEQAGEKEKNIKREWELEEKRVKDDLVRDTDRQTALQNELQTGIAAIDERLMNHQDSLYGWLNEHVPDWETTIGKVIDETDVLYNRDLHPRLAENNGAINFYGVEMDTGAVKKRVKTVADMQWDKEQLQKQLQDSQKTMAGIRQAATDELEKLRKRFLPKIKELRETVERSRYEQQQSKMKQDDALVRHQDWKARAAQERDAAFLAIENAFAQLTEEKHKAEEAYQKLAGSIDKQIDTRRKEKDAKVKAEDLRYNAKVAQIDTELKAEQKAATEKLATLKTRKHDELHAKGADTGRLQEIELRLADIDKELRFIENNSVTVIEYNKDKRELFDKEDEFKAEKKLHESNLETEHEKHRQQQEKLKNEGDALRAIIESIGETIKAGESNLAAFEAFMKTELYQSLEQLIEDFTEAAKTAKSCYALINELKETANSITNRYIELQEFVLKFAGNFDEQNLFRFKVKFNSREEYIEFALMLKEFIDENKLSEYKKRVEERFSHIIRQIGVETGNLISKEGEISQVIRDINNDFVTRNFVGAIKSMELKTDKSANSIFQLLVEIKNFNDEHRYNLGAADLFSSASQGNQNEKAILLLKQLIKEMAASKEKEITLSDSFELLFKIVENDNDTGWVEKLTNVGSEGTDVLVKAMINIMLLNVFKDRATRKQEGDFRLHCMMDEIGKLHPNNVRGILKFANDRNILLINSSPTSYNASDYRYTYLLAKDNKNITSVKRLVRKVAGIDTETVVQS